MYNSAEIAERIKKRAKEQGKTVGETLSFCGLGKNTVSKISKGTDILTLNFAKIADYLDCSVDYLLGRTDEPEMATKKAPLLSGAFEQDNFIRIAGRDGRYVEKELTEEQIQLLLKLMDQLPDVPDDL